MYCVESVFERDFSLVVTAFLRYYRYYSGCTEPFCCYFLQLFKVATQWQSHVQIASLFSKNSRRGGFEHWNLFPSD